MKNGHIMIRCDYDEPDPNTYRGFEFDYGDKGFATIRFFSDNPVVDYWAIGMVADWLVSNGHAALISTLSSVDHYVMDGGPSVDTYVQEELELAGKAAKAMLVALGYMEDDVGKKKTDAEQQDEIVKDFSAEGTVPPKPDRSPLWDDDEYVAAIEGMLVEIIRLHPVALAAASVIAKSTQAALDRIDELLKVPTE